MPASPSEDEVDWLEPGATVTDLDEWRAALGAQTVRIEFKPVASDSSPLSSDVLRSPPPDPPTQRESATQSRMPEGPTREEIDAKIAAGEARNEAILARAMGEVRAEFGLLRGDLSALKAASIGKTSFFFGLIALFGAIIAVLALAPSWFGNGLSVKPYIDQSVEQRVRQLPTPAPAPPILPAK